MKIPSISVVCVLSLGIGMTPALANAQVLGGAIGASGSAGADLGTLRGAGSLSGDVTGRIDNDVYGRTTNSLRNDTEPLRRQGRDLADDTRQAARADVYADGDLTMRTQRNRAMIDAEAQARASADIDARPVVRDGRALLRQGVRTGQNAAGAATSGNLDVSVEADGRIGTP